MYILLLMYHTCTNVQVSMHHICTTVQYVSYLYQCATCYVLMHHICTTVHLAISVSYLYQCTSCYILMHRCYWISDLINIISLKKKTMTLFTYKNLITWGFKGDKIIKLFLCSHPTNGSNSCGLLGTTLVAVMQQTSLLLQLVCSMSHRPDHTIQTLPLS